MIEMVAGGTVRALADGVPWLPVPQRRAGRIAFAEEISRFVTGIAAPGGPRWRFGWMRWYSAMAFGSDRPLTTSEGCEMRRGSGRVYGDGGADGARSRPGGRMMDDHHHEAKWSDQICIEVVSLPFMTPAIPGHWPMAREAPALAVTAKPATRGVLFRPPRCTA